MKLRGGNLLGLLLCAEAALAATPAPIYWDETQAFSLTQTPAPLTRYEGQAAPDIEWFNEPVTLSYHGALPSFTLAGQAYALSAVVVTVSSVWNTNYRLGGYDSGYMSDIYVQGSAFQAANLTSPTFSGGTIGSSQRSWIGEGSYDYSFVEYHHPQQWDWNFSDPINFSRTLSDTSAFADKASVDFLLFKGVIMGLTGFHSDDDWDYVSNPTNNWSGSMNLSYVYAPVPEPTELAMLLAGLGLIGIQASRRRARASLRDDKE